MRPFFTLLVLAAGTSTAAALPIAPSVLCESVPDAAECQGRYSDCATCHTSTWPASWNSYGVDIGLALGDADFVEGLPEAVAAIEMEDSDGDGVGNLFELLQGTNPGDADDTWPFCAPEARDRHADAPVSVGYDFRRALRRASILYCGRSPTYDELQAFDGDDPAPGQLYERLHAAVDACLDSAFWRDEALHRLADDRIRPLSSVGIDSTVGIVIGDYEWDYRLWSYVLTGDRDARDLLLATYHVRQLADGTLERVEGEIPLGDGSGPQPLATNRRAGMLTTQWFFAINTMFSPLPRTTAAQAYRAYLGLDIARQEGLVPIAGEPVDVDAKGVAAPDCATCHSTLDPLSYAFAEYNGISGLENTGTYNPGRPEALIPAWDRNATALFGERVNGVRGWAEAAAESDAFKRNLGSTFFRHSFEREPTVEERPLFDAIWKALPEDGYSANRLIHRLVDLDAFGGLH